MTKAWYQSKTIWVQLLTLAVGILAVVEGSIPSEQAVYITGLAIPILNVVLRFVTSTPLK